MFGVSDVAEVLAVATGNTFVYNHVLPISVNKGVCVCVCVCVCFVEITHQTEYFTAQEQVVNMKQGRGHG